ncbi:MarR family winged helix-turn-helix transcriptional regulator [Marinovum sp.]|uniref:MarR family winged helix-turn-helix transcriptional regulator n=1 Tax=Marinovum sp. TaxID=2024839 RepID=UPI002B268B2C|nr:MarR family winged helix-turn-helix transcriptional regulator [Marinovum sp.]
MSHESQQITVAFQRLAAFWRASQWQTVKDIGLNPTQGDVLARVAARPDRIANLADQLGITQSSLSDTVTALEGKGLVARRPDPKDGRARQIVATAKGQALAAQIPEAPPALEAAIDNLGESHRGAMLRSLTLIIRSLQEARAIPVQRMCVTCQFFRPHAHDDTERPHHCAFVDAAFGDAALKMDCPDHKITTEDEASRAVVRLSTVP